MDHPNPNQEEQHIPANQADMDYLEDLDHEQHPVINQNVLETPRKVAARGLEQMVFTPRDVRHLSIRAEGKTTCSTQWGGSAKSDVIGNLLIDLPEMTGMSLKEEIHLPVQSTQLTDLPEIRQTSMKEDIHLPVVLKEMLH